MTVSLFARSPRRLLPPRVLIVEDSFGLAEAVCDAVRDCGLEPVGPVYTLDAGLDAAAVQPIAGAVLDIDLRGQPCFPICAVLVRRGVPFLFLSGYCEAVARLFVPGEYDWAGHVEKPFSARRFRAGLDVMLGSRPSALAALQ